MEKGLKENLDKIIRGDEEIERIRQSVSGETEAVKAAILKRLEEREAVYKELEFLSDLEPSPSESGHFGVTDIKVHGDYSVSFHWSDSHPSGARYGGDMTLTKEEFVDGDFSCLKERLEEAREICR